MKPDQNYISRLEVGDTFQNTRGESCRVNRVDGRFGTIEAATDRKQDGQGLSRLRIYDREGNGSTSSESIKTP